MRITFRNKSLTQVIHIAGAMRNDNEDTLKSVRTVGAIRVYEINTFRIVLVLHEILPSMVRVGIKAVMSNCHFFGALIFQGLD